MFWEKSLMLLPATHVPLSVIFQGSFFPTSSAEMRTAHTKKMTLCTVLRLVL